MIKNYFKTAFRTLLRNKSYAAINIAGLAVGIEVCPVIFVIIQFELSYDGFHENKDRIYLNEKVANFYQQERRMSDLYTVFAILSIFLSCLGLYGLASFMAVQRLKEVGIRKVLGASLQSIVYLFSKEFIVLIAIAFLIAAPLTWYFLHQWLQNFQYKVPVSWWIFIMGGMASLLVALITISFKAIMAARINPVKTLRSE